MESFTLLDADLLSDEDLARGRDQVVAQMNWARQYSMLLIESVPMERWYVMPQGVHTHVAWQVGHMAVSQYGLMLFRQRGRSPGDIELMPGWLRKQFGRGSVPAASAEGMPSPEALLEKMVSIHRQAVDEVSALPPETLREPSDMPYVAYPTKLGALMFAPIHEGLHAGQLGMLRRLHGLDPLR